MSIVHGSIVGGQLGACGGSLLLLSQVQVIVVLGMLSWSYMYVFALFPRRMGIAYCALGSVLVAGALAATVHQNPIGVALVVLTTTAGAGVIVGYVQSLFRRQSLVDALTNLPNRGALDVIMKRELALAGRSGAPLTVGLIDLDGFKLINDNEGHLAGDGVLVSFAQLWRAQLRSTDSLVRYGGDEFVLVLPGSSLDEAAEMLDRMRKLGTQACSIGLTEWAAGDSDESVLARADAALYMAKERGRGCVATLESPAALIREAQVA